MATSASLLSLMTVIGLVSCCAGFLGAGVSGWGGSYSQVSTHHAPYGWGGIGGMYGSLGSHYGGTYGGGVHVEQSPVRYHGYSVGSPHVQSYGVHYPTPTVTHHHDTWHGGYGGIGGLGGYGGIGGYGGLGGYGGYGGIGGYGLGHSVQTVSHGVGHVGLGGAGWGTGGIGLGYGLHGFGHF